MTTEQYRSRTARVACGVLILAASSQPAYAYIDPGTGSMLIQMAIAGIAGALFFFRQLRMQFRSLVSAHGARSDMNAREQAGPMQSSAKDLD